MMERCRGLAGIRGTFTRYEVYVFLSFFFFVFSVRWLPSPWGKRVPNNPNLHALLDIAYTLSKHMDESTLVGPRLFFGLHQLAQRATCKFQISTKLRE